MMEPLLSVNLTGWWPPDIRMELLLLTMVEQPQLLNQMELWSQDNLMELSSKLSLMERSFKPVPMDQFKLLVKPRVVNQRQQPNQKTKVMNHRLNHLNQHLISNLLKSKSLKNLLVFPDKLKSLPRYQFKQLLQRNQRNQKNQNQNQKNLQ